jgi:hypothetical protein
MPKETLNPGATDQEEEIPIIKICSHCMRQCTHKNHKRCFGRNRKVTKDNILNFNKLMIKPRQKKKQIDESICEVCYGEFVMKIQREIRARDKKLDLEIAKNKNIDAEESEPEEGEFKEDGTLTDTFLKAIAGNLPFQIQISKN